MRKSQNLDFRRFRFLKKPLKSTFFRANFLRQGAACQESLVSCERSIIIHVDSGDWLCDHNDGTIVTLSPVSCTGQTDRRSTCVQTLSVGPQQRHAASGLGAKLPVCVTKNTLSDW